MRRQRTNAPQDNLRLLKQRRAAALKRGSQEVRKDEKGLSKETQVEKSVTTTSTIAAFIERFRKDPPKPPNKRDDVNSAAFWWKTTHSKGNSVVQVDNDDVNDLGENEKEDDYDSELVEKMLERIDLDTDEEASVEDEDLIEIEQLNRRADEILARHRRECLLLGTSADETDYATHATVDADAEEVSSFVKLRRLSWSSCGKDSLVYSEGSHLDGLHVLDVDDTVNQRDEKGKEKEKEEAKHIAAGHLHLYVHVDSQTKCSAHQKQLLSPLDFVGSIRRETSLESSLHHGSDVSQLQGMAGFGDARNEQVQGEQLQGGVEKVQEVGIQVGAAQHETKAKIESPVTSSAVSPLHQDTKSQEGVGHGHLLLERDEDTQVGLVEQIEEMPTEVTEIEETQIEETQVEDMSTEVAEVEETQADETQVEEAQTEEKQIEETQTEETQIEEEKQVEETQTEETQVEKPQTEETQIEKPQTEEIQMIEIQGEEPQRKEPEEETKPVKEPVFTSVATSPLHQENKPHRGVGDGHVILEQVDIGVETQTMTQDAATHMIISQVEVGTSPLEQLQDVHTDAFPLELSLHDLLSESDEELSPVTHLVENLPVYQLETLDSPSHSYSFPDIAASQQQDQQLHPVPPKGTAQSPTEETNEKSPTESSIAETVSTHQVKGQDQEQTEAEVKEIENDDNPKMQQESLEELVRKDPICIILQERIKDLRRRLALLDQ